MGTSIGQTASERLQLDRFLELFPAAPVGHVEKSIHPDFVVTTSKGGIGIELTQLYHVESNRNFKPREIEAFKDKIVGMAKDIYRSGNGLPLEVGVHFSGTALTDAKTTARNLVGVIQELASGDEIWRVVTHDDTDIPQEFSVIRIIKRPSWTNCVWSVSSTRWLPDLDVSAIQTVISKKNKKIGKYQKSVDVIWLLLVIDQEYLSSFFEVRDSVLAHTYDSAFSKTILLSYMSKRCWVLNTTAPK